MNINSQIGIRKINTLINNIVRFLQEEETTVVINIETETEIIEREITVTENIIVTEGGITAGLIIKIEIIIRAVEKETEIEELSMTDIIITIIIIIIIIMGGITRVTATDTEQGTDVLVIEAIISREVFT